MKNRPRAHPRSARARRRQPAPRACRSHSPRAHGSTCPAGPTSPVAALDGRGLEIRKGGSDRCFVLIRSRRDRGVRLRSKLTFVDLRYEGSHQLAVADRPCGGPAHRLVGNPLHRLAVEVGAVTDQLDDIKHWLARHCTNKREQGLLAEAVAAIENPKTHLIPPSWRLQAPRGLARTGGPPGQLRRTPLSRRSGPRLGPMPSPRRCLHQLPGTRAL